MRAERGAALIMVLWFAAALGVIAVDLTVTTRDTALKAANTEAGIRARAALEATSNVAFELLRRGLFDTSGQVQWQFDGVAVTARVEPESGKIDLNGAPEELIEGLARTIIEDEQAALDLAHAILDWRDENDLRLSHGAEKLEYRLAGLDYGPADRPFRHVRELSAVLGMTSERYAILAPALTIATGSSGPDELRASDFVRDVLDVARGLVTQRESEQEDDEAVTDNGEAEELGADEGSSAIPGGDSGPVEERPALGLFDDPAGLYTLDVQARLASGFTERSRSLVWISPPFETADFLVLQHESTLLPLLQRDNAK